MIHLALLALAQSTLNQTAVTLQGTMSADVRFRLQELREHDESAGALLLNDGISRNENRLRTKISAVASPRVKGVAELEFVWTGFSDVQSIDDLTRREQVDPYWLEAHAAYVDIYEIVPALDLRLGRQVVQWGTADQFNPTNTMNPLDLYDPLAFGMPLANTMVRLDWHPHERFRLTTVWTPVFRPARLPLAAPLAVRAYERIPIQDAEFRRDLAALLPLFAPSVGSVDAMPRLPAADWENTQGGARLATQLGSYDLSLSYVVGRDDFPEPYLVDARDPERLHAAFAYPRVQIVGADLATSLSWLSGVGVWAEAAVTFPQEITMRILSPSGELRVSPADGSLCVEDTCPTGSRRPVVLSSDPFAKWTVGGDYSITSQLYANVQWVHGFVDEFGTGDDVRVAASTAEDEHLLPRLGDYGVAGIDHRSFSDTLLLRVFAVVAVRAPRSAAWVPQVTWSVGDGAELSAGAFLTMGSFDTKFGDPAMGGQQVFLRGKLYF